MWLNIRFVDAEGTPLPAAEINAYEDLVTTTDAEGDARYVSGGILTIDRDDLVYEAKLSSALTGEEQTFHFVLATDRYKDNRIPPRGFRIDDAAERLAHPRFHGEDAPDYFTAEEYAGGYDEVGFGVPDGAAGWVATLYYQTTSKEYIEFLRDEINGDGTPTLGAPPSGETEAYVVQSDSFFETLKGWGDAIWDLWLHNEGAAPVAMTSAISGPTGLGLGVEADGAHVHFDTIVGRVYQVEVSDRLTIGSWSPVGAPVAGSGQPTTVVDPDAVAESRRFYRIVTTVAP